jgi:peptide/nickel transport system substrate-binding protein
MKRISRRHFLQASATVTTGIVIAACTPKAAPAPAAVAPEPTAAPAATQAPEATAAPAATQAPEPTAAPAATQAAAPAASKYKESPMLAELVKAGKLPPIEERLPVNPKLINDLPEDWLKLEVGQYGGTLRLLGPAAQYDNDGYMMCETPLLNTPGIQGDNITPNVLETFEANADNTVFTMALRKGLKWSDGVPVTTKDVQFVWDDWYNNAELNPSGPPAWLRAGTKATGDPMKLEIVDDFTFKCSFTSPYGGFPVGLAIANWHAYDVLLQPRHYLEQFHKKYAEAAKLDEAIKAGKFENWVQLFNNAWGISWDYMKAKTIPLPKLSPWILTEANDQRTVLVRNPYYFKVDAAGNQMPYIDRIEFTTVADTEVISVKQFAGESDYGCEVCQMPKIALYKANEDKGNYNLKFGNIHRTAGALFINLTYKDENFRKVVQDIRFRKAVNMAIDRKEVIDAVYYGYADPTTLVPNTYDPDAAMKLLDEMGMDKKDADGFRLGPDGKTFTILIEPYSDFWDHTPAAELYGQFWNKVGIKTTVKPLSGALFGPKSAANEIQASVLFDVSTLWYYQAYAPDLWGSLWNLWNNTGGKQGEEPPQMVKDLFAKTAHIMDVVPAEGRKVAAECEKMIYDNVLYFPLSVNHKQPRIENKKLGNMTSNELAFSISQTLSMEQAFYKA